MACLNRCGRAHFIITLTAILADIVAVVFRRAGLLAGHDFQHLVAVDGFPIHQGLGHGFHFIAAAVQNLARHGILLVENTADFGIHLLHGVLGNILRMRYRTAEKHFALVFAIHHRPHFVGHTIARDHFAGDLGGALKIVGCAGGNAAYKQIFGNAPAKQNRNLIEHLVFIHADAVALRQLPGEAERTAARHNGNFMHRVGAFQAFGHNGMAGFVVGGGAFFIFVHHHRAALGAHIDFVFGIFKIALIHLDLVAAAGKERRFVHQVGQIGAGKAGRAFGQRFQIHRFIQRHFFGMHIQNLLAAADIGQRHHHLAVETAGALQGRIEHIRAVGGGNHNHGLAAFKAIHLHQQLVERLLALIVAAAQTGAALAADGINFVDKDDAG